MALFVLSIGLFSNLARAENDGECQRHQRGKMGEKLIEKLELNDQQAEQVKNIFAEAKNEHSCREIDSKKESRKCMMEKREKVNEQISALLDDQQKAKFAKLQEERKEKWKERREKRRGDNNEE